MKIIVSDKNSQMRMRKVNAASKGLSDKHTIVDRNTGSFNAGNRSQLNKVVKSYVKNKKVMDKNINLQNRVNASEGFDLQDKAAEVGNAIYETVLKSGLARKALKACEHTKGTDLRIDVKYNSSYGIAAVGPQTVQAVFLADKKFYPTPVTISDDIMISGVELNTSSGDILEEKKEEGMNAVRIKEDRLFKQGLDACLSVAPAGHTMTAVGNLTPTLLAGTNAKLKAYNLPVARYSIAADVLDDLLGSAFTNWFSQYDKYQIVKTGTIGNLLGAEIDTDAYLDPAQKILESGEVYCMTEGRNLGGIADVGGVEAQPIDGAYQGTNGKGYFISEIIGLLVYNTKGIAKVSVVK